MWERFPPRMRKAISTALEEAGRLGSMEVLPEHLLIAIASDPESAAAFIFEHAGVPPKQLLERLGKSMRIEHDPRPRAMRFSLAALHVLNAALAEADRLGDSHVGTEHVALALASVNNNLASKTLADFGISHARADAAARAWVEQGMPRRRAPISRTLSRFKAGRAILPAGQKLLRIPRLAWHVYIGRSLGHPKYVTNPYVPYRWLRNHAPVRKDPLAPVWVISRYADVAALTRDPRFRKDPFSGDRMPDAVREQLDVQPDP